MKLKPRLLLMSLMPMVLMFVIILGVLAIGMPILNGKNTEQGLKALWEKPYLYPVPSKWNGPYLDTEIPPDPWGNEYQYKTPGPNNLPYEIFSFGADGEKGGEGKNADIYSWKRRE